LLYGNSDGTGGVFGSAFDDGAVESGDFTPAAASGLKVEKTQYQRIRAQRTRLRCATPRQARLWFNNRGVAFTSDSGWNNGKLGIENGWQSDL